MKHYGEVSPGLTALWYVFSRSSWLSAEINSSSVEIGSWCINNNNSKTEKSNLCWSIKVSKRNRALSKRTHLESREVVSGRAVRTIKKGQGSCTPVKPQQSQVGLFLLWVTFILKARHRRENISSHSLFLMNLLWLEWWWEHMCARKHACMHVPMASSHQFLMSCHYLHFSCCRTETQIARKRKSDGAEVWSRRDQLWPFVLNHYPLFSRITSVVKIVMSFYSSSFFSLRDSIPIINDKRSLCASPCHLYIGRS